MKKENNSSFSELKAEVIPKNHISDDVICIVTERKALDMTPIIKILSNNIPNSSDIINVLESFKQEVLKNDSKNSTLTSLLSLSLADNDPDLAKKLWTSYAGKPCQIFFKTTNTNSEYDPLMYLIPLKDDIADVIMQVKAFTDAIIRYTNPKLKLSENSLIDITNFITKNYQEMNIILTKAEFISDIYIPEEESDDNDIDGLTGI